MLGPDSWSQTVQFFTILSKQLTWPYGVRERWLSFPTYSILGLRPVLLGYLI